MRKPLLSIKLIIISCLIVFTIASCKKNSPASPETYSISFSIQGTKITDTSFAYASILTGGIQTVCSLRANSPDRSSGILIVVISNSDLNKNITYTDSSSVNKSTIEIDSAGLFSRISSLANKPDVKVNFTDITSTYVKGTFSGNLAATSGGTSIPVSNGTFYLPLQ